MTRGAALQQMEAPVARQFDQRDVFSARQRRKAARALVSLGTDAEIRTMHMPATCTEPQTAFNDA